MRLINEYKTDIISVNDRLPENKTYVLIHLKKDNWKDQSANNENGAYWAVAKFVRGISKEERNQLTDSDRKNMYGPHDEHGNNEKPYCWLEFGPGMYFGQDVDYWSYLPKVPNDPTE